MDEQQQEKPITPVITPNGVEVKEDEDKSLPPPPVTIAHNTMTFFDAIRELAGGKRIRRESWPAADFGLLKDGFVSIFTKGAYHAWSINDGDLEGRDWIVTNYEEKN